MSRDWPLVAGSVVCGLVLLFAFGSMLALGIHEIGPNPFLIVLLGAPCVTSAWIVMVAIYDALKRNPVR